MEVSDAETLLGSEGIFDLFWGPIGRGSSRLVFASDVYHSLVLKVIHGPTEDANRQEWANWQTLRNTTFASWFAPCLAYSPKSNLLLMERTWNRSDENWPRSIPVIFTDVKKSNFGFRHDGRFVCHDYTHIRPPLSGWEVAPW